MATDIAVFGGGCFWCTEAILKQLKGVIDVMPGYAGGDGKTGHAEVVKIEFDPEKISYHELLTIFFASHDPTTLNRQGADVGPQYRSIILTTSDEQRRQAEDFIQEINTSDMAGDEVVTEVKPLGRFHGAEEEHQDFYNRNRNYGYSLAVISPKLKKVRENFKHLIKEKL